MKTSKAEQSRLTTWDHVNSSTDSRGAKDIRKIEESIAYMIRHLDEPLRVSAIATNVNTSPSHFFYLFKRYVGRTPIDYFIRLRLRRACHLLENTNLSVKAIAYTLGYDDPFYFSRIFKSFNRITPSKYRCFKLVCRKSAPPDIPGPINFSCNNSQIITDKRENIQGQHWDDNGKPSGFARAAVRQFGELKYVVGC